ncbi:hypothetical protein FACS1894211_04000 [Clostridia bacterium]|nr:hypothetical protein FACS1894211_04000 [Clostridia bacterium]
MKKRLKSVLLSLCCVLSLILAACGGDPGGGGTIIDPDGGGNGPDGATSRQGALTIKVPMTAAETNILQTVVDEYRKLNPLVSISIDNGGAGGGYNTALDNALSVSDLSGVSFDIVRNNMVSHYFGSGKFVDFNNYLSLNNPYANNTPWKNSLDSLALVPDGSFGEIYSMSFQSTQVSFYYNKSLFAAAGIDADDIKTWPQFVSVCAALNALGGGVKPLSVNGSEDSFWSGQMSWIFRTYVDQYFRDAASTVHTRSGDWNYDPLKDDAWTYGVTPGDYPELSTEAAWERAYYNDDPRIYTENELRTLKKITEGEYGHNTPRYKNMLANLKQVFPQYCYSFLEKEDTSFWTGKSAIALDTTDLLVEWKKRYDLSPAGDKLFEIGRFDFPAMTSHPSYPEGAPVTDYTRSIGGPHGYYGIVNKSAKQTELAMDFMMFWVSKRGQDIEMQAYKQYNQFIKGVPYVKGVSIPDEINMIGGYKLKGIADFNPAMVFARGLRNEGSTTRDFQTNTQSLFAASNAITIDVYGQRMQTSFTANMGKYLVTRGYRSNALADVTANPFPS